MVVCFWADVFAQPNRSPAQPKISAAKPLTPEIRWLCSVSAVRLASRIMGLYSDPPWTVETSARESFFRTSSSGKDWPNKYIYCGKEHTLKVKQVFSFSWSLTVTMGGIGSRTWLRVSQGFDCGHVAYWWASMSLVWWCSKMLWAVLLFRLRDSQLVYHDSPGNVFSHV